MNADAERDAGTPVLVENRATQKHIRGSSMLLAGRLLSLGLNFGVQVLTVRYLSKGDYGAFAYALTIVSMGSSLSLFSVDKALSRYLPIYEEHGKHRELFGSIVLTLGVILGLGLAFGLIILGGQGLLTERVVNDPLAVSLLVILVWLSPVQALDNWFQSMFAVFARVRAIFFRRYIMGPGLKLLAVLAVIAAQADVVYLAWGYLIGGLLGMGAYIAMLSALVRQRPVFQTFDVRSLRFPVRDIMGFSAPLMYSDLVFLLRNNLTVLLLGFFHTATSVAEFRAMVPVARLNQVVMESFTFLYTPLAARLFARNDRVGINDLYWKTATWITILSFPVFIITFALAKPVTVLLFSDRYADSSAILALLALGYYFNAALGFNAHTLRVFGRIKYIMVIDFTAMLAAVILNLVLIPRWDALGAAICATATLIIHNVLNHCGLLFGTSIRLFDPKYLRVYGTVFASAAGLLVFQIAFAPPFLIGLSLALSLSFALLFANRSLLDVAGTFPEVLKMPVLRRFFAHSA